MLVLPALTAITSTASGANHQLCFYVDKTTLTGHTFACFMPKGGPQAGQVLCRGKYAAGLNIFGGPGKIKNDGARHWDQRICYVVTAAQYNGAAAKVNGKQAVPPPYHLVKNPPGNCTNWITAVAGAAGGIALPNKFGFFGIATPSAFGAALKAVGNGGVIGGGTVAYNALPGQGADGSPVASAPRSLDSDQAAVTAPHNPNTVASATGLPPSIFPLGTFQTTLAAGFSVSLHNTAADSALISMDWGDGGPLDGQNIGFHHTYAATGTYQAALAVINDGAIDSYQWSVVVQPAGPVAPPLNINVPTPSPMGGTNPGFDNTIDVLAVSDGAPALDGIGAGALAVLLTGGSLFVLLWRRRESLG